MFDNVLNDLPLTVADSIFTMAQHTTPSTNHALVFGASGLAGWAVVDQLLQNYPASGTFSKVIALVNRPLSLASSHWPGPSPSRPSLDLISGVNLLAEGTIEEFSETLKEKVQDIANVSHAFYFGMFDKWLAYDLV